MAVHRKKLLDPIDLLKWSFELFLIISYTTYRVVHTLSNTKEREEK